MVDDERIVIVRKSAGHAGHHGGAWKVAYADFVTALMALFIVLWLMNTSKPIQEAVGGYFRDPNGTGQKKGTQLGGAGDAGSVKKQDMSKLKEDLMESMAGLKGFDKLKKLIEMTITPEGLRIELMEDPKGTFFENGSAQPTPVLQNLVKILAAQIGKLPNTISIEGHTDSKPYADSTVYSNWELSTDRANTARRLMENNGLHPGQVVQVRGYADHNLRKPQQPFDASNRRVSLIVQYVLNPPQPPVVFVNGTLPPIPKPDGITTPAGNGPAPAASKH
jgi:chemotaxis protein MotB